MRQLLAGAVAALLVLGPGGAAGQTSAGGSSPDAATEPRRHRFSLEAAAGPTVIDGGHTLSAAAGYLPTSWLELLVNAERIHVPLATKQYRDGYSVSRGGTRTFISGEARFSPMPQARVSPFASAGAGIGSSRPNVTDAFPDRVANDLRVMYVGGGLRVPLGRTISLSADARAMIAVEGYDSVAGVWPVRVGVAWRF
jgi:hypothetical protein